MNKRAIGVRTPAYEKAVRHSRRVKRLKIILPVAATLIAIVVITVFYVRSYLPDNLDFGTTVIEKGKIVMNNPSISGRKPDGAFYSMSATRALQDIASPNLIDLEGLKMSMPTQRDVIANVEAQSGHYNRTSEELDITSPFTLHLSNGIEGQFQSGHVNAATGDLSSDAPVSISSKTTSIVADSMQIEDKGGSIIFDGHVKVVTKPVLPAKKEK